jgi:hypothetical protein
MVEPGDDLQDQIRSMSSGIVTPNKKIVT